MEVWKPVTGFEGVYSVSNRGKVRREPGTDSGGRNWPGRELNGNLDRYGYVKFVLTWGGKPHYRTGHRLVCEAFHGPAPEGKNLALHRDDIKTNNTPCNLYWGSLSDNQQDIIRNGNNFGRNKTHCVNGHKYTPENTYRSKNGNRRCQECRRNHTRKSNRKRREANSDH